MKQDSRFTDEEFRVLLEIQNRFLDKILEVEKANFDKGLEGLDTQSQQNLINLKNFIVKSIRQKADFWVLNKLWEKGVGKVKDIYWKAQHLSLLPPLYKDYRNIPIANIRWEFSGEKINDFLKEKYPYLSKSLENIHFIYCDLRKEYKKNNLSEKLGFGQDLPNETIIPDEFTEATIKELHRAIISYEKNLKKETLFQDKQKKKLMKDILKEQKIQEKRKSSEQNTKKEQKVMELHNQGKSQLEIKRMLNSEKIKISQPTISLIIQKYRQTL